MNDKARQNIFSVLIVILLLSCVFSSFYGFPVEHVDAATSPVVQTNNATGVEETNATLHGTLTDGGVGEGNVTTYYSYRNPTIRWGSPINADKMIDGILSTYAEAQGDGYTQRLTGDIFMGDEKNYGNITTVSIRAYGYHTESAAKDDIIITPALQNLAVYEWGDNHTWTTPLDTPAWSSWYDITNDTNLPGYGNWTWSNLSQDSLPILICNITTDTNANTHYYVAKVEIRVNTTDSNTWFQYGTTTSYGTNTTSQVNETGDAFSTNATGLSPGTLYHYRSVARNTNTTSFGSDIAFLTKPDTPTNAAVARTTNTSLTISWTKGTGANNTYIERNTTSTWSRGDGTPIYNDTGTYYVNTGLTTGITHYYQFWSYTNWTYNPTIHQWSDNYTSDSNITYTIEPPYDGSSSYTYPYVNLTWSRGNNSDQEVIVQNNNSYSTSPTDGWVRQNSTNTWFNESITYSTYFTIWSYNSTSTYYSGTGLNIPWGTLSLNCYDEETNESLWFDVSISNQDGSQTYESRNNTNPHYLDISQLPIGNNIKITVSAASNYSEKSEISYWSVDENQTITYIVLSQTADSKATTNVTCINVSSSHHSYPPFTLDADLITILPDNADNFTKIFVNYTHEEYSSRLYYRDIEENVFSVLNAYLPPTIDKQLYLLEVIDEASNTVEDAYIEVKRSVNGTYVVVSRLLTDANGQVDINLISDKNYIFIISKDGYVTENASWTPGTSIFTHTFKIIWEVIPVEPDTFGDIISFYGTLYVNNTIQIIFYDLDNATTDSHFLIYEDYNDTLTYIGEYNGTTSNDITFWINVTNATRLHVVVLFMNHSTLGEVINHRIFIYPVHIDRESGNWLESLIRSVVGDFDYGYVITFIWYLPCVLLIAGLGAAGHPGTGILGAGLYSMWITWYLFIPEEAKILTFASIALVTGSITLFLVKGKKVIH